MNTLTLKPAFFAVLLLAVTAGCDQNKTESASSAATNSTPSSYAAGVATNVDNTKINVRDRGNANPTALDQGNSDADTKLSAAIRKMVVSGTNNFSVTAQNIKIITQNGKVTLRGRVTTDGEKEQIESIAKNVAGDGNVENNLEVKADN